MSKPDFTEEIGKKSALKARAKRRPVEGVGVGLGMMGLIGWSVSVPTLLGAALGRWLDGHHPDSRSWTLALLVAGLCVGCFNAWHWVAREDRAMHTSQQSEPEESSE